MTDAGSAERPATAGDVVRSVILTTADRLVATQSAAIADEPDGVHQHRTHVRRLRSVLAGLRGHLDEAAARELRVRFKEWGRQLGVVRDMEVQADFAEAAMDELDIHDPDMRRRLVESELEAHARAHARLCELFDSPRSVARMAALEAFVADPPMTAMAGGDAKILEKAARHEARRVEKAARRVDGSTESLHALRKAGRRLRYVAEALHEAAPVDFGAGYEELAAAGEDVHDALGDHRDELIFIERLEVARAQAGRDGERVGPYDALIERSTELARERLKKLDHALARVKAAVKDL